jgi:hypothetical protein
VLDRAEAKDYLDIVALLRAGLSLERALGAAVALTFYGDGNLAMIGSAERTVLADAAASVHTLPTIEIVSTLLQCSPEV